MLVNTRFFGEVDLPEEKILTFEHGLIGLGEYKKFTILYDCDKEDSNISWLQSVEEPSFALPVIKPWLVKEDYNPVVEDELLKHIGELTEENLVILTTMTVPEDVKQMSVNLKAPIIINGCLTWLVLFSVHIRFATGSGSHHSPCHCFRCL